jgi:hypothetical protein
MEPWALYEPDDADAEFRHDNDHKGGPRQGGTATPTGHDDDETRERRARHPVRDAVSKLRQTVRSIVKKVSERLITLRRAELKRQAVSPRTRWLSRRFRVSRPFVEFQLPPVTALRRNSDNDQRGRSTSYVPLSS